MQIKKSRVGKIFLLDPSTLGVLCLSSTYPRGRREFRKRGDVLGGHVTGQLEPIPADLLHADLLPLSYVKCGLHTGAGHHSWHSWTGNAPRHAPCNISGAPCRVFVFVRPESIFAQSVNHAAAQPLRTGHVVRRRARSPYRYPGETTGRSRVRVDRGRGAVTLVCVSRRRPGAAADVGPNSARRRRDDDDDDHDDQLPPPPWGTAIAPVCVQYHSVYFPIVFLVC